jgi:hypothetical protein
MPDDDDMVEEEAKELENDLADEKVCSTLAPLLIPVE